MQPLLQRNNRTPCFDTVNRWGSVSVGGNGQMPQFIQGVWVLCLGWKLADVTFFDDF